MVLFRKKLKGNRLKNLPLIVGLLFTVVLSLYCVDFHTESILQQLNHQVAKEDCPKRAKAKSYVEEMAKPIEHQVIEKSKATPVPKKIVPQKENKQEENELDILAKKILENMKKNKDEKWKQ